MKKKTQILGCPIVILKGKLKTNEIRIKKSDFGIWNPKNRNKLKQIKTNTRFQLHFALCCLQNQPNKSKEWDDGWLPRVSTRKRTQK